MKKHGAVAAGHDVTARAAADVLEAGGNAFDAVTAAMWTACVAEPVLASLGGGGFVMARPAGKPPRLYDFFVETPLAKRPREELEFESRFATFAGGVTQEFHGGYGSVATPGVVAGIFKLHDDLGSLPMAMLAEPAITAARDGIKLDAFQRYVMGIVTPLMAFSKDSRAVFGAAGHQDEDGFELPDEGSILRQADMADSIEYLLRTGADGFYHGDLGHALVTECREYGGYLTGADLAAYRVLVRDPLLIAGRNGRFVLNPPPASGGVLVGFGLKLAREIELGAFGSARHLEAISRILHATGLARSEHGASPAILADEFCESYRSMIGERPLSQNGTTHISVVDGDGNLAAATISNGSCSGRMVPGTGIMLNNMLGEADLSPDGFHHWPCGVRMTSMMTPALYLAGNGDAIALGSGGSNRIRSTMLQVMLNIDAYDMTLHGAVAAPRLHVEDSLLSVEPGFDGSLLDDLSLEDQQRWDTEDMFFGGVHAAKVSHGGKKFNAVGDARRNGHQVVIADL
ncbi:gamma-glutamyltranspeptidase / glutathione hydrolase [Thalassospira xiamenensis M-5 = DSM 17429]|uniref:Gamma-glutamyltransferase n=1 Tax=Thalassospira xiamenensis M-5 = DSM 17429 TaxID=1123366 RepID=A0AB72U9G5_9PROT|nr:gamma-glutamyltransferase [Thalassospira xiamenensis]AJD50737.1 gamma-glutamyltransferase [Thalassospira xiamenensis M-5 = DSM 17429]SIS73083.1 gamma-glutamyltranspeptidase / glutathione hydrolase [Thalassospira xiamenensis M-5 = DSM 17429]